MTQRTPYTWALIAIIAVLSPLACVVPRAVAQPGGSGLGDFPNTPGSLFGKKKESREISGPSLSATDEPVADIRIVGNSTIPTSKILNDLQTRVGRPFDPVLVQRDVRRLAARGWFVDVQPSYEQAPNGRIVIFKVVERPIVRYVEYLGNSGIRTSKLSKETDLKVGGPVDPYAVQEAKRKLIDLYHRNGFNNAQINILEGDKPTDHGIVFVINEGEAQKIWKVEFIGNEFISERRLKTKIDSKPPILWLFKGYVDEEQIEADKNKLTAFYRSFGYFDAKIGAYKVFDDKNKWMTLKFVIHEGQRYQVESVAFIGNKIFASDSLTKGVELKPDPTDFTAVKKAYHLVFPPPPGPQPFEQDRMNADVNWLKELYGSQGYIFADVKAEPIFLEQPGQLRILYHIEEGKRWRIGNVYVHINGDDPHTKIETALNRLSLHSGQIADIREVHASERRLQASGLFLTDPVHGVAPKITYHIPELGKDQMASGDGSGFRGQSPDDKGPAASHDYGGIEVLPAADMPPVNGAAEGPPVIAPPQTPTNSTPPSPAQRIQTYKVESASQVAPNDDQLDLHLYIDNNSTTAVQAKPPAPAASQLPPASQSPAANAAPAGSTAPAAPVPLPPSVYAQPSASPASTPRPYEVRRYPYDDYAAAPQAAPPQSAPTSAWGDRPSYPADPAPTNAYSYNPPAPPVTPNRAYSGMVIRTQSPYQPDTTQVQQASNYPAPGATSTNPYSRHCRPTGWRRVAFGSLRLHYLRWTSPRRDGPGRGCTRR